MRRRRPAAIWILLVASACVAEAVGAPDLFVRDDIGVGRWRMVSVGKDHSCGIDIDGRAYCWGSNEFYQLGVTQTDSVCGAASTFGCSLIPVPLPTGRHFTSISAGGSHTCAISTDSVPFCWGSGHEGQVGASAFPSPELRIPVDAPMIAISTGMTHTCGIRADSLLFCWGSNAYGAVGEGPPIVVPPTLVSNTRYIDVVASDQRTCARTVSRQVQCWGVSWVRTIGDTNFTRIRTSPVVVQGTSRMSGIGVGANSTCGIDTSGFVWCWDSNLHGEAGVGGADGSTVPRRILSDDEFRHISLGAAHACGITSGGAAVCWGSNAAGQLGSVTADRCTDAFLACSRAPQPVFGGQKFVSISAGLGSHTCGVTDQQNLYCWGAGSLGQRGDGTRIFRSVIPRLAVSVYRQ